MAFDDLERRMLDAVCGAPTTASAGAATEERQPTQREILAKWIAASEAHSAAPPERITFIAPTFGLAQALRGVVLGGAPLDPLMELLGIDVLVNENLPRYTRPVRRHKLRHGHAAYHKRIQKKWVKRFGVEEVDPWYAIASDVFGGLLS